MFTFEKSHFSKEFLLMNRELLSKTPFTLHQSILSTYILITYTGEGLF